MYIAKEKYSIVQKNTYDTVHKLHMLKKQNFKYFHSSDSIIDYSTVSFGDSFGQAVIHEK